MRLVLLVGFLALLMMALAAVWLLCVAKSARRDRKDSLRLVKVKLARGEISESEYQRVKEVLKG